MFLANGKETLSLVAIDVTQRKKIREYYSYCKSFWNLVNVINKQCGAVSFTTSETASFFVLIKLTNMV